MLQLLFESTVQNSYITYQKIKHYSKILWETCFGGYTSGKLSSFSLPGICSSVMNYYYEHKEWFSDHKGIESLISDMWTNKNIQYNPQQILKQLHQLFADCHKKIESLQKIEINVNQ